MFINYMQNRHNPKKQFEEGGSQKVLFFLFFQSYIYGYVFGGEPENVVISYY